MAGRRIRGAFTPPLDSVMTADKGIDSISPRRKVQRRCACWADTDLQYVPLFPAVHPAIDAKSIVDRPEALDFSSFRCWLLKIVFLALDSDPSLIPRSSALPGMVTGNDDDDFRFWSERQAQRIAYAIRTVLDIEFAPEVIVADANVSTLTRRILAPKQLLGP